MLAANQEAESSDLLAAFRHMLMTETDKTAPKPSILLRYASFYKEYFKVAPSGLVLASTIREAILAVHQEAFV